MSALCRQDVTEALAVMGRMIAFFPADDLGMEILAAEFQSMIGTREQLKWLTRTAARTFRKWGGDKGDCSLPALRALYCSHYDPLDGVQPTMELADSSIEKLEAEYRNREMLENTRKIEQWKAAAALNPGEYAPLFLIKGEVLKPIPAIKEAWPADNKPDHKLKARELHAIEDQITETAAEAASNRRTDEEAARAAADLRIVLEQRGNVVPPDPPRDWGVS